jgi:ABC-type phosphate transport system permease subunit
VQTLDTPTEPRAIKTYYTKIDRVFRGFVASCALFSLVVLTMIAAFLLYRGFEIFSDFGLKFITTSKWDIGNPEDTSTAVLGIGAMLVGSVVTAFIAIVVARIVQILD